MSNVSIKTVKEVDGLRVAGQMAAETLLAVGDMLRPGITTEDINQFVHQDTLRRGGVPAPLNYHGFPKSVCTSINEVVCHGIPGEQVLEPGDIINVDVTTIFNGFYGDTSATFYIGEPSPEAKHVTEVSRRSLALGIAQVRDGARLGDIGAAIQEFAEGQGCSVVRAFVGHGIGRRFHEPPQVSHVGTRNSGLRLRAGMVFTIEPMINIGTHEVEVLEDKWTAVTADGSLSAQFEHTLVVTKSGCEVLTRRSRSLERSEIFPDPFELQAALAI
ncbi:type I methionyl aminopeptidase [Chondromyces crocatus]|uniref:Methionine aminopeptidase n=1 Tax=Chondromyces crocatus TaxID=52 RepID=A0A0K1EBR3_CHOCO|nr:type I methionyl aminopeptidase [Chondromyces crocatus]AKT38018.1 methionine aminopeptidase [Chondromyces crocatus]